MRVLQLRFPENSLPVVHSLIYSRACSLWPRVGLTMKVMDQQELLVAELKELRRQHRALDEEIAELAVLAPGDPLTVRRLKKRKLQLKDDIKRLEDKLYPDIIA